MKQVYEFIKCDGNANGGLILENTRYIDLVC